MTRTMMSTKVKKPYVCLACGKHYGGLLVNFTDLETRTCRVCKGRLTNGETAFHCKDIGKTVWVNQSAGVREDIRGRLVLINKEQYEKLTGRKEES